MMRLYLYILIIVFSISCETDNVGPLLEEEGVIFFLEDGISEVLESNTDEIVIAVGAIGEGSYSSSVTLGGTAVEGVNYNLISDLKLDFPSGEYIDTIVLSLIDNEDFNDDHTIVLSLPDGQGYSENNRREFVINIRNDEVNSGTEVIDIQASEDDVEEGETGAMLLDSSDLELGEFDTSGTPDQGLQTIGLRYNGLQVPKNATIKSAFLQFTVDNIGSDPVQLTIFAEATANAGAYTTTDFDLTSRAKTNASVVWNIAPWTTEGESGPSQRTVNLASVVQEIVNQGGWTKGNSINFILEHSGPSIGVTESEGGREAETFDGDGGPVLTVEWEIE